ncbi:unnamed protein product [Bursaphelenchus xylophilus]|uniref:(pine wood nematode) hypothetical protein n=1 Tax=Bursaphelenchus xylophilus TaxID=6326 RepID=A0A1I7RZQ7_BURXY|nr:unnamed protein product [Bursaphelenchus xylophilus]CAG9111562.1 unnamed protein product [Bursaphelenchus xylophilus]
MFQRALALFFAAVFVDCLPLTEPTYHLKLVGQLLCNGTSINGSVALFENGAPRKVALSDVEAGEDGKFEIEGSSKLWSKEQPLLWIYHNCNGEYEVTKRVVSAAHTSLGIPQTYKEEFELSQATDNKQSHKIFFPIGLLFRTVNSGLALADTIIRKVYY